MTHTKDKTYRELDAILEMTHGGCQITVPTIKGSCHKSANQAIQEHIVEHKINELSYFARGAEDLIPRKDLLDRIEELTKQLKDKGGSE